MYFSRERHQMFKDFVFINDVKKYNEKNSFLTARSSNHEPYGTDYRQIYRGNI